jgi:putative ABC transport system ATP-binding protein
MVSSRTIFHCRGLVKRRAGPGASFELRVPELDIFPGEVVVVRGVSGSGKSTLLDILALALRPDTAETFTFRPGSRPPADVRRLWVERRLDELGRLRGTHIGYVLQTGGLLSFLTARENIVLACRLLGREAERSISELTRRLNIAAQLDKLPRQLFVGERQRVAISRAMAHAPCVVLADEPTASVDPVNAAAILELFLEIVRQMGVAAVIATHDWSPDSEARARLLNHRIERDGGITRSLFWG